VIFRKKIFITSFSIHVQGVTYRSITETVRHGGLPKFWVFARTKGGGANLGPLNVLGDLECGGLYFIFSTLTWSPGLKVSRSSFGTSICDRSMPYFVTLPMNLESFVLLMLTVVTGLIYKDLCSWEDMRVL
jgi:hypothetical protein